MSPSHHVRHSDGARAHVVAPPISRLVTPMIALTSVLITAPKTTSAMTSLTRSRRGENPATRRSRYAPVSASSVLPTTMPITVSGGTPVFRLVSSAPSATAGHNRYPPRTNAASAIPVGGQIAVTLRVAKARSRPSLPDTV